MRRFGFGGKRWVSLPDLSEMLGPRTQRNSEICLAGKLARQGGPERTALIACLADGTLSKRCGVWTSQSAHACGRRIAGVTVADLIREGMLTVSVLGRSASAWLTPRGSWFARTAAAEIASRGKTMRVADFQSP
jgi:hypothetical protein